jgi:hypothetical protein
MLWAGVQNTVAIVESSPSQLSSVNTLHYPVLPVLDTDPKNLNPGPFAEALFVMARSYRQTIKWRGKLPDGHHGGLCTDSDTH